MNAKHTPGPWRYSYGKYIEAPRGNAVVRIAIVDDGAGTESGNGCLLAAAPELLEALENVTQAFCWHLYGECRNITDRRLVHRDDAIGDARAAIAKAKGEEWH